LKPKHTKKAEHPERNAQPHHLCNGALFDRWQRRLKRDCTQATISSSGSGRGRGGFTPKLQHPQRQGDDGVGCGERGAVGSGDGDEPAGRILGYARHDWFCLGVGPGGEGCGTEVGRKAAGGIDLWQLNCRQTDSPRSPQLHHVLRSHSPSPPKAPHHQPLAAHPCSAPRPPPSHRPRGSQ